MVDIDSILVDAINRITARDYKELPLDLSLSEIGLDSLGLSQIILSIEEETGWCLDDELLSNIIDEETMGGVRNLLTNAYGRA